MTQATSQLEAQRQTLVGAQQRGLFATLGAYTRLSGPGWLQSAITLGGGSLAGSLYLGVLGGFTLLWLQPLAMILGIVMLSAIGYVTMSTGERPFAAINNHVNPVLGWTWALACLAANMVWCLPQFALANSVFEQNLWPGLYSTAGMGPFGAKLLIAGGILIVTVLITWSYGSGHWGLKLYESLLKLMVAMIVICFILVVYALTQAESLQWGAVLGGFVPSFGEIFSPSAKFQTALQGVGQQHQAFWSSLIVNMQVDRMATAAATAVGINMTFLFPYSILRKGWTKEFRGLQVFDLATGMFIPFVLATSCVVIASATQFHAQPIAGLVDPAAAQAGEEPNAKEKKAYRGLLSPRLKQEIGPEKYDALAKAAKDKKDPTVFDAPLATLPLAERNLAAMLVERDANRLAQSLAPLTGRTTANTIFGLGVVGMTLSTITLLMLISGFVICEIFNLPSTGWGFRLGCLAAAVGVLGPFIWGKAGFALAVPTSVFGLMLLPLAYVTFFFLMNQRKLLGDEMPRGGRRIAWNGLMLLAAAVATVASLYMVWLKAHWYGVGAIAALLALVLIVQLARGRSEPAA